jgi:spore cortex formation protein SpoVR/YcgB (stage V sporulation)
MTIVIRNQPLFMVTYSRNSKYADERNLDRIASVLEFLLAGCPSARVVSGRESKRNQTMERYHQERNVLQRSLRAAIHIIHRLIGFAVLGKLEDSGLRCGNRTSARTLSIAFIPIW